MCGGGRPTRRRGSASTWSCRARAAPPAAPRSPPAERPGDLRYLVLSGSCTACKAPISLATRWWSCSPAWIAGLLRLALRTTSAALGAALFIWFADRARLHRPGHRLPARRPHAAAALGGAASQRAGTFAALRTRSSAPSPAISLLDGNTAFPARSRDGRHGLWGLQADRRDGRVPRLAGAALRLLASRCSAWCSGSADARARRGWDADFASISARISRWPASCRCCGAAGSGCTCRRSASTCEVRGGPHRRHRQRQERRRGGVAASAPRWWTRTRSLTSSPAKNGPAVAG